MGESFEMSKADRISGIFVLLFAVVMGYQSYRSGLGTLHKPGPGFLFFYTSIVLGCLSIVVIVRAFVQKEGESLSIFGPFKEYWKAILVIVFSILYALLMEPIGFIPVTLAFFVVVLGVIEKKSWTYTILVSLLVTVAAYLLFEVWLKSQLPKGLLESLRF
jgi:putative tricarboxylic transport membrane protein